MSKETKRSKEMAEVQLDETSENRTGEARAGETRREGKEIKEDTEEGVQKGEGGTKGKDDEKEAKKIGERK